MHQKFTDELRATKNQQPFVPFEILVSDGQRYPIQHPDAISWDDEDPRVLILTPRRMPSVKLRIAQITGITELPPQPPPPPKAKPKRKGK
jgi:hypothetical protein